MREAQHRTHKAAALQSADGGAAQPVLTRSRSGGRWPRMILRSCAVWLYRRSNSPAALFAPPNGGGAGVWRSAGRAGYFSDSVGDDDEVGDSV